MKIEKDVSPDWFAVHLGANELTVRTGKKLPFATTIGAFRRKGGRVEITVITPTLKGTGITATQYRESAKLMIELAALQKFEADAGDAVADEWEKNPNGELRLHEGYGGEWWIRRVNAKGDIVEQVGPFRDRGRAFRERAYLAKRTA